MRVLQVICIILAIFAFLLFGLFFISDPMIDKEKTALENGTELFLAEKVQSGGQTKYKVNGTEYTYDSYKEILDTAEKAMSSCKIMFGAAGGVLVVGAIGFGIGAGKKKRG